MNDIAKDKPQTSEVKSIKVEARPRSDVGNGMVEVTVTSHKHQGSSIVLTSPRNFAFRKEKVG